MASWKRWIPVILQISGYTKDEVLATNNVQFSTLHDLEYEHTEHNLGDLMSDAYVCRGELR